MRHCVLCPSWPWPGLRRGGGWQGPLQRGEPRSVQCANFQPALTLTSFPRSPQGEPAAAAAAVSVAAETDPLELGLCALKTIDRGQHKRRGFRLRAAHSRCSTEEQTLCEGPRGQRWVLMDGTRRCRTDCLTLLLRLAMGDTGQEWKGKKTCVGSQQMLDKRSDEQ